MAIPVLKLDLAPPPSLWRQHHRLLGWTSLLAGSLALAAALAVSYLAYREAGLAGQDAVLSTEAALKVVREQGAIQERLRGIDVEKELPVWRLAERILSERSLPWSRLTAELERSLVQDVRLKSLQRTRDAAQGVVLKIRGEAKSRTAEEAFVEALQGNAFFTQVVLERESDRQGGGVEFEYTLSVSTTPPPYAPLPKYGPPRTTLPQAVQPRTTPPAASQPPAAAIPPKAAAPLPPSRPVLPAAPARPEAMAPRPLRPAPLPGGDTPGTGREVSP